MPQLGKKGSVTVTLNFAGKTYTLEQKEKYLDRAIEGIKEPINWGNLTFENIRAQIAKKMA